MRAGREEVRREVMGWGGRHKTQVVSSHIAQQQTCDCCFGDMASSHGDSLLSTAEAPAVPYQVSHVPT